MAKKKYKNPIIEIYKGKPIHQYNPVMLKLGPSIYKFVLDEVERTGLSIYKILAYSSRPCEKCKDVMVIAYDRNDEVKKIKRGILSHVIPNDSGLTILQQSSHKK